MSNEQGEFMGDDLNTDVGYLEIEVEAALKNGSISRAQYNKRMERIQKIASQQEENDW